MCHWCAAGEVVFGVILPENAPVLKEKNHCMEYFAGYALNIDWYKIVHSLLYFVFLFYGALKVNA